MKLKQLITKLQAHFAQHGDMDVVVWLEGEGKDVGIEKVSRGMPDAENEYAFLEIDHES